MCDQLKICICTDKMKIMLGTCINQVCYTIVLRKKNQASASKEKPKNIRVVSDLGMSGQAVFMVCVFAVE